MPEAKQNERLLTDEERKQCGEDAHRVCTYDLSTPIDPGWEKQYLVERQDAKTLKEVGEWLIKHYHGETWLSAKGQHSLYEIMLSELKALKEQGEMPKE